MVTKELSAALLAQNDGGGSLVSPGPGWLWSSRQETTTLPPYTAPLISSDIDGKLIPSESRSRGRPLLGLQTLINKRPACEPHEKMSPLGSGREEEEEEEEETPGPRQTQLGGEVLVQITSQKIAAQSLGRDQSSTRSTVTAKEKTAREKRGECVLLIPLPGSLGSSTCRATNRLPSLALTYPPSSLKKKKKEPSSPCVYL